MDTGEAEVRWFLWGPRHAPRNHPKGHSVSPGQRTSSDCRQWAGAAKAPLPPLGKMPSALDDL